MILNLRNEKGVILFGREEGLLFEMAGSLGLRVEKREDGGKGALQP